MSLFLNVATGEQRNLAAHAIGVGVPTVWRQGSNRFVLRVMPVTSIDGLRPVSYTHLTLPTIYSV